MVRPFLLALAVLLLSNPVNATPGATAGAIVFGTGAAIVCDELVRSYMEPTPESDEAWYLVWHHVGTEDVAGFAAGTACAIPAAAAGAAVGLAVETAVVGASVTAVGAGTFVIVGKGLHVAGRALAPGATRHAVRYAKTAKQHASRWMGQFKIGPVVPPSIPRRRHLPELYSKQRGMDGVCTRVPLPPLYVGPLWKRRFNPDVEVDHKVPRAKGGPDLFSNFQATHEWFNKKKGVLTGYELRSAKRKFCPV